MYAQFFSYVYVLGWFGRITLTGFPTEPNTQSTIMSRLGDGDQPSCTADISSTMHSAYPPPYIMISQHLLVH